MADETKRPSAGEGETASATEGEADREHERLRMRVTELEERLGAHAEEADRRLREEVERREAAEQALLAVEHRLGEERDRRLAAEAARDRERDLREHGERDREAERQARVSAEELAEEHARQLAEEVSQHTRTRDQLAMLRLRNTGLRTEVADLTAKLRKAEASIANWQLGTLFGTIGTALNLVPRN